MQQRTPVRTFGGEPLADLFAHQARRRGQNGQLGHGVIDVDDALLSPVPGERPLVR